MTANPSGGHLDLQHSRVKCELGTLSETRSLFSEADRAVLQLDCTCSWSFATKVKLNDVEQA